MKRYLLFDSGCSLDTEVARRVKEAAGGWLEVRSLRDPEMRAMLDKAKPGWKWKPTLVEVDGDEVRVYQGVGMRIRMVRGLGVRKSLAVAKEVRKASGLMVEVDWGRRRLLKAMGGLVGALVVSWIKPHGFPTKWNPRRGRHPLYELVIRQTRELTGKEKEQRLQEALQAPDVANVLQTFGQALDFTKAAVFEHILDVRFQKAGIRLWRREKDIPTDTAVHLYTFAIPTQDEESALIYHELNMPLAKPGWNGDQWQYKSEAIAITRQKDTVHVVAVSINGKTVLPRVSSGAGEPVLKQNCGGCVDFVNGPWEYDDTYCTSMDWNCALRCALGLPSCAATCALCFDTANPYACWSCFGCAFSSWVCIWTCCTHWEPTCSPCLAP